MTKSEISILLLLIEREHTSSYRTDNAAIITIYILAHVTMSS